MKANSTLSAHSLKAGARPTHVHTLPADCGPNGALTELRNGTSAYIARSTPIKNRACRLRLISLSSAAGRSILDFVQYCETRQKALLLSRAL